MPYMQYGPKVEIYSDSSFVVNLWNRENNWVSPVSSMRIHYLKSRCSENTQMFHIAGSKQMADFVTRLDLLDNEGNDPRGEFVLL